MSAVKDTESAVPGQTEVMAQAQSENFPVAAFFLPGKIRRHLLDLYGFARLVDDLGDEVAGDRLAHLDWLESELDRTYSGSPLHPLMRRLALTVNEFAIPRQPFLDLIEANRRDQTIKRYANVDELIEYCSYSANPVGRLVLYVFSAPTEDRFELSDAVCTGLQLVEHWQDVAEDYEAGRIYIPGDDMERFGVSAEELGGKHASPRVRPSHGLRGRARSRIPDRWSTARQHSPRASAAGGRGICGRRTRGSQRHPESRFRRPLPFSAAIKSKLLFRVIANALGVSRVIASCRSISLMTIARP